MTRAGRRRRDLDRRVLRDCAELLRRGLDREQAVEKLRAKYIKLTPYGRLVRLGFSDDDAVRFLREVMSLDVKAEIEARAEAVRARNAANSRSSRAAAERTKRQRGVHGRIKRDHRGRFTR